MAKFALITDSCSDLGKDVREKYDIDYVQMHIRRGDKELPSSLDWDVYTAKELYDWMRKGERIMTTQVPAATFLERFEKYLKEGRDVLYIGCSSALSGSVNTAQVIAGELEEKYPDRKIHCIDALNSSLGEGLMVIDAAVMRDEGKTADEVADYFVANRLKYLQFATVGELTYLKRAGRVKASAAFFGNLFGVKPIIISNKIGENFACKKVKGRKTSLDELVELTKQNIENPEEQLLAIAHADCIEDANYLKERLIKELNPKDVYINFVGPTVGASTGPDTIMIYSRGKAVEI